MNSRLTIFRGIPALLMGVVVGLGLAFLQKSNSSSQPTSGTNGSTTANPGFSTNLPAIVLHGREVETPDTQHWATPGGFNLKDFEDEKFLRWVSTHPDEAMQKTKAIPDDWTRYEAHRLIITAVADDDFPRACDYVKAHPDSYYIPGLAALGAVAGRLHGKAAWDQPLGDTEVERLAYRDGIIQRTGAIHSIAETDGVLAATLVDSVTDVRLRQTLVNSVANVWVKYDPEGATNFAFRHQPKDDPQSQLALTIALTQWRDSEPVKAAAWVNALPPGESRIQAMKALCGNGWIGDMGTAQELVGKFQGGELGVAVASVTEAWGRADGATASQWLATITDENAMAKGADSLATSWSQINPTECEQWVGQLPPGKARDAATGAYATSIAAQDIQSAMKWAVTISDEDSRGLKLRTLTEIWMRKDEAAASRWVTGSLNIPTDLRQELLEP